MHTREAVLDSAEYLFALNGLSRTSLECIARHANFSRGAVYAHFRNKGDVFQAIVERAWQPVHDSLFLCSTTDSTSRLCALRDAVISTLRVLASDSRQRRVADIVLNKSEFVDENSRAVLFARLTAESTISNIQRVLTQGIQMEELSSDLDVPVMAQIVHSQISGMVHDLLRFPDLSPLHNCILAVNLLFDLIVNRYAKITDNNELSCRIIGSAKTA